MEGAPGAHTPRGGAGPCCWGAGCELSEHWPLHGHLVWKLCSGTFWGGGPRARPWGRRCVVGTSNVTSPGPHAVTGSLLPVCPPRPWPAGVLAVWGASLPGAALTALHEAGPSLSPGGPLGQVLLPPSHRAPALSGDSTVHHRSQSSLRQAGQHQPHQGRSWTLESW